MALAVDSIDQGFFADIFKDAMRSVVPEGDPTSLSRRFAGYEGFSFSGFGHEGSAFLLLQCLRGVPIDIGGDLLEQFVLEAMLDCSIKGRRDQEGFLTSLTEIIQKYQESPSMRYACMFFLQVSNVPDWLLARPVLGHKIRRAPNIAWKASARITREIERRVGIRKLDLCQMVAVEVIVRCRRPQEAISMADRVSRVLRGAFFVSQGTSWSLGGVPKRGNEFGPSPLYLVRENRKHVQCAYTHNVERSLVRLPNGIHPRTSLMLDRLTSDPAAESPLRTLSDALELFAASGDEKLLQHRFMGLWRAIECLAMTSGGDTNRIAKRIGNLYKNGNETIQKQLQAVAPVRNQLVHAGAYEAGRQSVTFLLENIVRDTLIQFAQLSDKLPTKEHFMALCSMMTLSDADLERRSKTVRVEREALKLVNWIRRPPTQSL